MDSNPPSKLLSTPYVDTSSNTTTSVDLGLLLTRISLTGQLSRWSMVCSPSSLVTVFVVRSTEYPAWLIPQCVSRSRQPSARSMDMICQVLAAFSTAFSTPVPLSQCCQMSLFLGGVDFHRHQTKPLQQPFHLCFQTCFLVQFLVCTLNSIFVFSLLAWETMRALSLRQALQFP